MRTEFGFYPRALDGSAGTITLGSLPNLESAVEELKRHPNVDGRWIYSPTSRVFGLPHTHFIAHTAASSAEQLHFLVWCLGFFVGMRLTPTQAGFLDATPIEPGMLCDFAWEDRSDLKALAMADRFWMSNSSNPRIAKVLTGVINSLFLAQQPGLLAFEEFVYLYTAFEGCHWIHATIRGANPINHPHADRIPNLCRAFGIPVPAWTRAGGGGVAALRNATLHDGLFFEEPLGFATFGSPTATMPDETQQMRALLCRLVMALLGLGPHPYLTMPIRTLTRHLLRI